MTNVLLNEQVHVISVVNGLPYIFWSLVCILGKHKEAVHQVRR